MKAIIQKPGETPETVELREGIDHLQELVGGCFTTVYHEGLEDAGITVWANDEGLLVGLSPNIVVYGQPIVGPIVFTGHNDEGETVGLDIEQEDIVRRFLEATTLNEVQRERVAARIAELF